MVSRGATDFATKWIRSAAQRTKGQIAAFIDRRGLKDPFLIAAIAIGMLVAIPGINWGSYDCLNLDRMAFKNIFSSQRRAFEPTSYVKPPFYTYMCHFAARVPAMVLENVYFFRERHEQARLFLRLRTFFARCLNMVFFALCTSAVFVLARSFYSVFPARAAALVFATSCGFIPYQVFLTTDLAVVFMMMASFVFAAKILRNPGMVNSVAAGLLAGLACATKYNGLAVAAALPVAHLLAGGSGNLFAKALRRPAAWVCGLCVPLGFAIGNPYSLIDWPKFSADFLYNYTVTPAYGGFSEGTGYARFFASFYEIFGVPGSWFVLACSLAGVFWLALNFRSSSAWKLWLLSAAVFALYTYKIGAFPRIETRFVLPAAPFALLLALAGMEALTRLKFALPTSVAALVVFNLASGFHVCRLFSEDPRHQALKIYEEHLKDGYVMEYSESLPKPEALKQKGDSLKMQMGLERIVKFRRMYANDPVMISMVEKKENQTGPEWFSMEERKKRGTDLVAWSTIDLEGLIRKDYEALFDESNGYRKIFDKTSPDVPAWVYPRNTEFLKNRTTIWTENWKS